MSKTVKVLAAFLLHSRIALAAKVLRMLFPLDYGDKSTIPI
jgi:hypothetical protein